MSDSINVRQLLDLTAEGAEAAGADLVEAEVTLVETVDEGFVVETDTGDRYRTEYVVAATENTTDYLDGVDGLYAAGRLAEKPHQAVVATPDRVRRDRSGRQATRHVSTVQTY